MGRALRYMVLFLAFLASASLFSDVFVYRVNEYAGINLTFQNFNPRSVSTAIAKVAKESSLEDQMDLGKPITLVVNLPYRRDKWKAFNAEIKQKSAYFRHNSSVVRLEAVIGKDANIFQMYNDRTLAKKAYLSLIKPRIVNGKYLTPGGLGCLLSHIEAWKFAKTHNQTVVVFEDDIILNENFDSYFEQIKKELPGDFGMLYFADMVKTRRVAKHTKPYSEHINRLTGEYWGTYAYMITPISASTLLEHVYPLKFQVDSHIISITKKQHVPVFRAKENIISTENNPNRKSDVQVTSIADKTFHPPSYRYSTVHILIPDGYNDDISAAMEILGQDKEVEKIIQWTNLKLSLEFDMVLLNQDNPLYALQIMQLQAKITQKYGGIVFSGFTTYTYLRNKKSFTNVMNTCVSLLLTTSAGFIAGENIEISEVPMYPLFAFASTSPMLDKIIQKTDITLQKRNTTAVGEFNAWLETQFSYFPSLDADVIVPFDACHL